MRKFQLTLLFAGFTFFWIYTKKIDRLRKRTYWNRTREGNTYPGAKAPVLPSEATFKNQPLVWMIS
jgi:hypothetical protein